MSYDTVIQASVMAKDNDSLVKSGKYDGVLQNGHVVVLNGKSDKRGEHDVFDLKAPATASLTTDIFYQVYEAPVPVESGKYKNVTKDPRAFCIPANKVTSIYKPCVGDEIRMSVIGGTKAGNTYIAPVNGKTEMEWVADTTSASLCYELLRETFISIGNERVKAYDIICVKA